MPPPPPPPSQRPPTPSRAGRTNLFSAPPPPLSNRRYPQHRSLPPPPLPPRRRHHPKNHAEQPSQEQEPTDGTQRATTSSSNNNPAFRAAHLRTAYRKPVSPVAAAGEGETLLAADPADAASGRSVVVGPTGLSFRLPGAPFDFQFSYSEAPRAPPLAIREPAFLPFAPPTMPRPWTGKAPLLSKEEKARRRGVRLHTPLGQEPPQTVSAHGIMMEVRGRRQMDLARVSPGDGRTREEVLGEPLTRDEVRELVKPHISHNRQLNIAKNGIYITLVKDVRDAFEANDLAKIDCEGLNPSDYKKIGAKLRDLVPCVLLSFDNEQILMYRGKEWKSRYSKPLTLIPKVSKNNPTMLFDVGGSDANEATDADAQETIREVLMPKMFKLWKSALDSSLALLLDDAEANDLTPDSLLMRVEEFSITSQAVEHSFPALLVANCEVNTGSLNGECINDESETSIVGNQEDQLEQSPDLISDEHFELDMLERLESSVPLGSLPIDTMIEQLNSE
nr:unnamed protein product [Digitaria exilis]